MNAAETVATDCVVGSELCDDGNGVDGDGCSAACVTESGYTCSGVPSACASVCGNGIVAGAEACDDEKTAGDGCSGSFCVIGIGYTCAGMPSQRARRRRERRRNRRGRGGLR